MSRDCWVPLGPQAVRSADAAQGAEKPEHGAVSALVWDPGDPSGGTMFAGTATGLFKTVDGGRTWQHLFVASDARVVSRLEQARYFQPVHALAVERTSAGKTLLWVGTEQGVLSSDDGGTSWDHHLDSADIRIVEILGGEPALDGGHEVLVGTTVWLLASAARGRMEWTPVTGGVPRTDWSRVASFAHSGTGLLVARLNLLGSAVILFRLVGREWVEIPLAHDGWKRTLDTGRPSLPYGRVVLGSAPSDRRIVYAAFIGSREAAGSALRLLRSEDSGSNWAELGFVADASERSGPIEQLAVHPTDPNIVAVSFKGTHLLHVRDVRLGKGDPVPAPGLRKGVFSPQGELWAVGDGGVDQLSQSASGISQWLTRASGVPPDPISSIAANRSDRSSVLAAAPGRDVLVYRSHPVWKRGNVGRSLGEVRAVAISPAGVWYAMATSGGFDPAVARLLRKSANGSAWEDITPRAEFGGEPISEPVIALGAKDGRTLVYVPGPFVDLLCFEEADGTWSRLDARVRVPFVREDIWISAIAVAPTDANILYVGTQDGRVFRWDRGSSQTNPVQSPQVMPGTVTSLDVDPSDPNRVVGTVGPRRPGFPSGISSVITTDDGGATWSPSGAPSPPGRTAAVLAFENRQVSAESRRRWSMFDVSTLPKGVNYYKALFPPTGVGGDRELYVASDLGVLVLRQGQLVIDEYSAGLPPVPVTDLLWMPPLADGLGDEGKWMLRAATHGRGVWERVVDPVRFSDSGEEVHVECAGAEVYLRDSNRDTGDRKVLLPLDRWNEALARRGAVDVKLGAGSPPTEDQFLPASFVFETRNPEPPRAGGAAHLDVQVHNRGPTATTARVRALFRPGKLARTIAGPAGPELDPVAWPFSQLAQVFDAGLESVPVEGWRAAGPVQTVEVSPATPAVVRFAIDGVPSDEVEISFLVVAVDHLGTPASLSLASTTPLEVVALAEPGVLSATTALLPPTAQRSWIRRHWKALAGGVGVVVLVVVGVYLIHSAADDD
jgi:photosystem II stability/assembly factor-like uncharacterized protein